MQTRDINKVATFGRLKEILFQPHRRYPGFWTIANNTNASFNNINQQMHEIEIDLHWHNIVTLYEDGRVQVWSRGWRTTTTKQRINQFLKPLGYSIYARDYQWIIYDFVDQEDVGNFEEGYMFAPRQAVFNTTAGCWEVKV